MNSKVVRYVLSVLQEQIQLDLVEWIRRQIEVVTLNKRGKSSFVFYNGPLSFY